MNCTRVENTYYNVLTKSCDWLSYDCRSSLAYGCDRAYSWLQGKSKQWIPALY